MRLSANCWNEIDVASILAANRDLDIDRTDADIQAAVERARESQSQQAQLFSRVTGFDPQAAAALTGFGPDDVLAFLEGILHIQKNSDTRTTVQRQGAGTRVASRNARVLLGVWQQLGSTRYRQSATGDSPRSGRTPMDFASAFFTDLIDFAQSPDLKGESRQFGRP